MKNHCIHYWHIDQDNYGRCLKCPAKKQFPTVKMLEDEAWLVGGLVVLKRHRDSGIEQSRIARGLV